VALLGVLHTVAQAKSTLWAGPCVSVAFFHNSGTTVCSGFYAEH
jgi:hypothetical protein